MDLSCHLTFSGACEEAFQFYRETLGGRLDTMLTYGDSPLAGQVPPEWHGKIVHATLILGDRVLSRVDLLPEDYERPQGFYVLLHPSDPAESERLFRALSENGAVRMPLQQTFWSPSFGALVDRFGIPWEISSQGLM